MVKRFLQVLLGISAFFFSFTTKAQTPSTKTCDWISDKGYWVVESNRQTTKEATVYFYNNDNILVYKEKIRDQKLKLNKKKTLYRLKAALEEAIAISSKGAWVSQKHLVTNHLQE